MEQKKIRLLRPDEIECRIGAISEKGLSLLLFMDARAAQNILDETFTPFGWRRTHQEIGGRLYCTVEIWDQEKKQWIGKQDVGTESFAEKEKGAASDSFKRACFNWGIGRELYSAPFIGSRRTGYASATTGSGMSHQSVLWWDPSPMTGTGRSADWRSGIRPTMWCLPDGCWSRRSQEGRIPSRRRLPGLREGVEEARQRQPERSLLQR